ncbi:hypothetical protein ACLB2K_058137 [Fragaria x ananassa]
MPDLEEKRVKKTLHGKQGYGLHSVAGLYDYGSPGCKLKKNVLMLWNQHFVLEENMWEIDCPCLTPEAVLKADQTMLISSAGPVSVKAQGGKCFEALKINV